MKKVLIVDDNRVALEGMKRVIDWKKFNCELSDFAMNGLDAWKVIEEKEIDIVITDIEMPKMNGLELLNKIRENKLDIKLIFMSCYEEFDFIKSAIDMDAIAYVLKPIVPQQLENALIKIMNIYEKDIQLTEAQNRLDNIIENHISALQEHFFRSLTFNTSMSEEEIIKKLNTLHIDIPTVYKIQLAIIECVNTQNTDEEIISLLDMQKFINNISEPGSTTKSYIDSDNHLYIVSIYPPEHTDFINSIYLTLNEYSEKNNVKFKIGISNESGNICDFKSLYSQAENALSSTCNPDENTMILYSDVSSFSEYTPDFINHSLLKKELTSLFFSENGDDINAFLDKFMPSDSEKGHEYYIRYFCYCTISTIEALLTSFNIDYNKAIDHSIIWDKLAHYESITNIRQWLYNILKSTLEVIYENTQKKDINVVDKVKQIIEQDYSTHLTLNNIAERVFFSSIHTNNLFKKETGLTVAEYLTLHRINIAKEMLKDPDSKIYAVSEAVGYKNQSHFKLLFNQITGYTPMEYKKLFNSKANE